MIKAALKLFLDYFIRSDERAKAWTLFIAIVILIIIGVGITALFSTWYASLTAAFLAKDIAAIFFNVWVFLGLVSVSLGLNSLRGYFTQILITRWRVWYTKKLLKKYLSRKHRYLELARNKEKITNVPQRIQNDVLQFVENTVNLTLGFIDSLLTLVTLTGTLWVLGGAFSFFVFGINFIIPGYLVWIALITVGINAIITSFIGSGLAESNKKQADLEGDLRGGIQCLNDKAEEIATERSRKYYKKSLLTTLKEVKQNSLKIIKKTTMISSFQGFCDSLPYVIPYITSLPLYMAGKLSFDQVSQIGYIFNKINTALSWFINSYTTLAQYKADVTRVVELEEALDQGLSSAPKDVIISYRDSKTIEIRDLDVTLPQKSDHLIIMGLNLSIRLGERTLITGESGLGKSTLFKVLAGVWSYGKGSVTLPSDQKIHFVPQKPVIPYGTLRAVLAFPEVPGTCADCNKAYEDTLRAVNLEEFIPKLDDNEDWGQKLSLGQQQRVSVARALIKKPDILFLDEPTASLDKHNEKKLYEVISNVFNTVVTISHNKELEEHHQRKVELDRDSQDRTIATDLPLARLIIFQPVRRFPKPISSDTSRMRADPEYIPEYRFS
ncbi:MAG: ABC transporter ATP-binding protein/permease [Gammaproteobacteria bacterium]|nr:ABC transporter ATP-binding protein/permease [Gammaproteobacteria bacterium]